uniref:Uncharacterized protein n=1 Tax=Myoviridae sp. ctfWc3 TaxID=2827697 RepID=A0A8S5SD13_9CAUD|nr:MAG TPA: hypothetical protein [Myoviridae sp. ctfWc3]
MGLIWPCMGLLFVCRHESDVYGLLKQEGLKHNDGISENQV